MNKLFHRRQMVLHLNSFEKAILGFCHLTLPLWMWALVIDFFDSILNCRDSKLGAPKVVAVCATFSLM